MGKIIGEKESFWVMFYFLAKDLQMWCGFFFIIFMITNMQFMYFLYSHSSLKNIVINYYNCSMDIC